MADGDRPSPVGQTGRWCLHCSEEGDTLSHTYTHACLAFGPAFAYAHAIANSKVQIFRDLRRAPASQSSSSSQLPPATHTHHAHHTHKYTHIHIFLASNRQLHRPAHTLLAHPSEQPGTGTLAQQTVERSVKSEKEREFVMKQMWETQRSLLCVCVCVW